MNFYVDVQKVFFNYKKVTFVKKYVFVDLFFELWEIFPVRFQFEVVTFFTDSKNK